MANELLTPKLVPDSTYYALIYNAAGQVFNGSAFEAFTDANYATYDVALTELGTSSGRYAANLPGALSATTLYSYEVFRQVGGSPSLSADVFEAQGELGDTLGANLSAIPWNASWDAEVQSEATDALNVYDPPTRAEATTDVNSVLTRLGTPAGASVSVDVAAVKVDTAAILVDTGTTLDARIPASLVSGRMDSSVGTMAANVMTAAAAAPDLTAELQSGLATASALLAVQGVVDNIEVFTAEIGVAGAGLTNLNLPNQTMDIVGNITGNLSGSVGSVTAGVTVTTNNDKTGYSLSAAAVQAIWDAATSALTTAGSIGKKLTDWTILTSTTTADAVWNAVASSYNVALSMGSKLNASGSAGDPWITALPGAYGAGTAGKIVGDNINTTISSRASQVSVDDLPTNAELATSQAAADDATLAAIAALNNLSAAQVNAEADTALVDAALATATNLATAKTAIDAIKLKTDTIPASPAAVSNIPTAAQVRAEMDSNSTKLTAIASLFTTAMTESYHADGVAPTPAQALFVIMQRLTEFSIADTTITVNKLNGSTTAYTLTLNHATTPTSSTRAT